MAVYVDNARIEWRNKLWCHLVADSLEEIHAIAGKLNLRREWFQVKGRYPHYDVTVAVRDRALSLGAIDADKRQLIECAKRLRAEYIARIDGPEPPPRRPPAQASLF